MCGRYAITSPPDEIRRLFAYEEHPNFPPRYNIAPTQPIPTIRAGHGTGTTRRHFALARWAFLPAFAKDPKNFPLVFNARSEGLGDKPSFRHALRRRRCLVPADCFYEWQRLTTARPEASRPFLFKRVDRTPLALAGLWETWTGPNGEEVDTACLITTAATEATAPIHPRLPVVIEPGDFDLWLEPDEADAGAAARLLRPPADDILSFFPITDAINKVAHDGPGVQRPSGEAVATPPPRREPQQGRLF